MPTASALSAILVAAAVILAPAQPQAVDGNPARVPLPILVSEKHKNITFADDCFSLVKPSCTTVFGKKYTHNVLAPAASGAATGLTATAIGVCTASGGPPGGATCAAIFGAYNGFNTAAIAQAAAQNQCAAYTTWFSDAVAVWKTDFGPDCQD